MSDGVGARTSMDGNTAWRLQSKEWLAFVLGKGRLSIQRDGKGGEVVQDACECLRHVPRN